MIVYMVRANDENKGQFYTTREEAERQAGYLNDIPNDDKYTVIPVEI